MLWNEPTETHARTFAVRRVPAINFPNTMIHPIQQQTDSLETGWTARRRKYRNVCRGFGGKWLHEETGNPSSIKNSCAFEGQFAHTFLYSLGFFFKEMTLLDNRPGSSVYPITRKITRRPWNSVTSRAIIIRASEFSSSPLLLPLFSFPSLSSLFLTPTKFSRASKSGGILKGEKK